MSLFLFVLLGIISVILFFLEIPKMWQSKEYKQLAVYSFLLLAAIVVAVLKILDIKMPNPSDAAAFIFSPVVNLISGILE